MRFLLSLALIVFLPLSLSADMVSPDVILSLINEERVEHGVLPLVSTEAVSQAALLKVKEVSTLGTLVHTRAEDGIPWWTLASAGYAYTSAGENLALSFDDEATIVSEWMNSPSHRDNMLNPTFTDAGVGVVSTQAQGAPASFVVFYGAEPKMDIETVDLKGLEALINHVADLIGQLLKEQ